MLTCNRRQLFGEKTYEFLIMCYLGLGRTEVQPAEEYERKSVGTESTFREMSDSKELRAKLRWTAEELEKDMRKAECKGRTLVLKVKLHTYEVLTRQTVTPRAVSAADDLYNFSLPILTKLELEIPGMKLRLMGLRCTNLISTKKPNARAFFGLRPLRVETGSNASERSSSRETVEAVREGSISPRELEYSTYDNNSHSDLDDANIDGHQALDRDSNYHHHGKDVAPNPKRALTEETEEWWDCPICSRPQQPDERSFNEHIDLCLSRQTIRDTVQQNSMDKPTPTTHRPPAKRLKHMGETKRGKTTASADPRQKKLFFG